MPSLGPSAARRRRQVSTRDAYALHAIPLCRCRHGRVMELAAAPSNDALRPGMARALDGRNGRIKEAARDGGSRALHAVASHGRMPVCVYLLEKHVQRKCQRTFGHSFFLFSQQVSSLSTSICAISNHRSRILNIFLYDIQPVIVQAFV